MKAQFKYAFRTGFHVRGLAFIVIFIMFLVFAVLGALGFLPLAARIAAVSLGGTAIAAMMVFNIVSDVSIVRRMFAAPGAYLYALTPAPRKRILLSSIITMAAMDIVTMAAVIAGEVLLAINMSEGGEGRIVWEALRSAGASDVMYGIWGVALLLAGYFLVMMLILFCMTVRKSLFYNKPVGGLLTAALALAIIYIVNLLSFILAPFGEVSRFAIFFTISLGRVGSALYVPLTLIEAAVLFILTSKLMERKVNI